MGVNSFDFDRLSKLENAIALIESIGPAMAKGAEAYTSVAEATASPKLSKTAANLDEGTKTFLTVLETWKESAEALRNEYKALEEAL